MAKLRRVITQPANGESAALTMRLFDPGMSILHRAGLGGLACTLRYIERAHREGAVGDGALPGGPWESGKPPWTIDTASVTLEFGKAELAAAFLKALFQIAFQIRDGMIYLPAQHQLNPGAAVSAAMQQGLTLTFLQHGKAKKLNAPVTMQHDPEGDGRMIIIEYRPCSWYKHQDGWKDLCDTKGRVRAGGIKVVGPLNPGAMVRHVAYTAQTGIEDPPQRLIPLYFALVGCLALSINRGSAVLLVPDVTDLMHFASYRPLMTPTSTRDCQITSAGDAALQAQVRLRAKKIVEWNELPGCHALTFQPTPWASQQKSRVRALTIPPGHEIPLEKFEIALAELPPRIVARKVAEDRGRGNAKQRIERTDYFYADSAVRPLVADNLARGRRWYQGFVELMTRIDPVSKRPTRDRLRFETKGLQTMTQKIVWEDRGESAIVRAVHEALRRRYGQIADENRGNPVAMKKRWTGEYDRWRLAFSGAKTLDQLRQSLCDLFSRSGVNSVLQAEWTSLLPMLSTDRWQLTRDLALLGLASYTGRGVEQIEQSKGEPGEIEAA